MKKGYEREFKVNTLGEGITVICRPNPPIDGGPNGYGWLGILRLCHCNM